MRTGIYLGFAAALALIAAGATPAAAAPTAHSAVYGDWSVECQVVKAGQSCDMNQRVIDGKAQIQLVRFAIVPGANGPQVQILVPLGAWLQPGVAVQVEGVQKPFAFSYAKCAAFGCLADGAMSSDLLTGLKTAAHVNVLLADRNRKTLSVPLSLKGFGEAYQALQTEAQKGKDWWSTLTQMFQPK